MMQEGDLLWQPDAQTIEDANLTHYMRWLQATRGLSFDSYATLWQWSVDELEEFWASVWDYFAIKASQPYESVLVKRIMPGAQWFVGARLNYAENIFAKQTTAQPMMVYKAENQPVVEISWQTAYEQVNRLAITLRNLGVQPGDRVVGYLPNMPEAVIALLATTSIGAVWSSCPPDFGTRSVVDRFVQIAPKVLIAVDGYTFGGKEFDRRPVLTELQAALPTVERVIVIGQESRIKNQESGIKNQESGIKNQAPAVTNLQSLISNLLSWQDALNVDAPAALRFEQVPFDHPLWVLYSSGTTGLPKPIVQGHGGILLEHAKVVCLQNDLHPTDRYFWYSSTGWMLWNLTVGTLLSGCTIVLYNGSPGYPDLNVLWDLVAQTGITYYGMSAAYVVACIKADIHPNQHFDLSHVRAIGSSGSPLALSGFQWLYENVNRQLALESMSGGTDVCTAFVGGIRTQPIYAGELQGPCLGARVHAFNEAGQPVIDEVGELVITEPMPSMPLYFWNDANNERYLASYFDTFPGVWRHGDWIKFNQHGGCVIYGRSDSTINRQGVRMGTSEIYQAVETLPEILDSLVIDLEFLGRPSFMPLFVVLREGAQLDEALKQRIKQKLRQEVSPRHAPDEIYAIQEVPYTLTGKKMEVPIRKILLGFDVEKAATPGAMRNPAALVFFVEFAKKSVGQNV